MKKLVLTLAIVFAGFMTANAQVWLGGYTQNHFEKGAFTLSIAPEIGYSFENTPFSVACAMDFILDKDEFGTAWGLTLSPYVRWNAVQVEKFNFFLDLTGDFAIPNMSTAGWRVGVQPGVAWNATEHWTAACRLGFIGYGKGALFADGFNVDFASKLPAIGLYYNF